MNPEQATELSRLASLWATARVRKAMVAHGCGSPHETSDAVHENCKKANAEFHEYLRSLMPKEPK